MILATRVLLGVILTSAVLLTYRAIYESLAFKIDSQVARNEAILLDQDGIDPMGLNGAMRLEKW